MANYAILCHCDGADASTTYTNAGTGGTLARTGSAALSTANKKFGTAGSNHTVNGSVLSASSVSLGTGDFTVSWQQIRISGAGGKPFCIGNEGTVGGLLVEFFVNQVNVQVTTTGSNTNIIALTGTNLGDTGSGWHHVVLERKSGTIYLTVDGVNQGSVANTSSFSGRVMFGDKAVSAGTPEGGNIGGYMDELLVINDTALYTGLPTTFTPPTAEYTIPSSGVTTTLSVTDAADTVASTATVAIVATLSRTDAADTLAAAAAVGLVAALAGTDAADTLSSTAAAKIGATLSTSDAADTLGSTAAVTWPPITANLVATDTPDTLSSAAILALGAALAVTDAADTISGAAAVQITAAEAANDAPDTVSSLAFIGGTAPVFAALAVTDEADALLALATITGQPVEVPGGLGGLHGGFDVDVGPMRRRAQTVYRKPILQRVLEERYPKVKPKKERAQRRAKKIELEAAALVMEKPITGESRFAELGRQWMRQGPVLPPALAQISPMDLFAAQVAFRIRQQQMEDQALRMLAARRAQDEEDALIALLLA